MTLSASVILFGPVEDGYVLREHIYKNYYYGSLPFYRGRFIYFAVKYYVYVSLAPDSDKFQEMLEVDWDLLVS